MSRPQSESAFEYKKSDLWKSILHIAPKNERDDPLKSLPESLWQFRGKLNASKIQQTLNLGGQDVSRLLAPKKAANDRRRRELDYRARAYRDPQPRVDPKTLTEARLDTYQYQQLPSERAIRLLHLQAGKSDEPISITLTAHEIDHLPPFEALSYLWGVPGNHSIWCDGGVLEVQPNLWAALHTLRHETSDRTLWVDAICIDQKCRPERESQIQLMRDIYGRAETVPIWLGIASENTEYSFQLLEKLATLRKTEAVEMSFKTYFSSDLDDLGLPDAEHISWRALDELYWRQWFSRIWIIQEVALAQKAHVLCGNFAQPWEDFVDAAFFIRDHTLAATVRVDPLQVLRLHDFRQKRDSTEDIRTLLDVLITARDSLATDDRDKIFGLLGLLDRVSALYQRGSSRFSPSYKDPVELVYTHFAQCVVQSTHSLDCLSAVDDRRLRLKLELPSWVPDWEVPNFATPFCRLKQYWEWQASGALKGTLAFRHLDSDSTWSYALVTTGAALDEITSVGNEFQDNIPFSGLITGGFMFNSVIARQGYRLTQDAIMQQRIREWEQMAHKCRKSSGASEEENFRTFVQTMIAGAKLPKAEPSEASLEEHYHAWRFFWPRASVENGKHIDELNRRMDPKRRDMAMAFMQLHYQAAYRRRFFTTRKGYMGLGPSLTRMGDKVVVLNGGRTPYVLSKGRMNQQYALIGEAYVHSVMYGAAIDDLEVVEFTVA